MLNKDCLIYILGNKIDLWLDAENDSSSPIEVPGEEAK